MFRNTTRKYLQLPETPLNGGILIRSLISGPILGNTMETTGRGDLGSPGRQPLGRKLDLLMVSFLSKKENSSGGVIAGRV
jgi:hypothetical protein